MEKIEDDSLKQLINIFQNLPTPTKSALMSVLSKSNNKQEGSQIIPKEEPFLKYTYDQKLQIAIEALK